MSEQASAPSSEEPPSSEGRWATWYSGLHTASVACKLSRDSELHHRLREARRYIDGGYGGPVDLAAVAKRAHYSPYHFHRLFRERYGVTPQEYLTEKRIREARSLLAESELSVTQVCLEVGFSSLGSFSTLFKRHAGHSPSRYRRRFVQCQWQKPSPIPWCFRAAYGGPVFNPQR